MTCAWMIILLFSCARTTSKVSALAGRHYKFSPKQCRLAFLLFVKYDNTPIFEAFEWNWSKSAMSDDTIFNASCINYALLHKIK